MTTKIKNGFTLAEVLITLAIIGVVAAMTLPTLIQKHQKKVLATKFQQSLSILSQGFQKMMADEEVTDFYETTLGRSDNWNMNRRLFEKYFKVAGDFGDNPIVDKMNEMGDATDKAVGEYCDSHGEEECGMYQEEMWNKFYEEMDKAYNGESDLGSSVVSLYQLVTNGGFDPLMLFMQNGLTIGGMKGMHSLNEIFLLIDTNGNAKPNKAGYDRFIVSILDTGLVVPIYSKHHALDACKDEMAKFQDFFNKEFKKTLESMMGVSAEAAEVMLRESINAGSSPWSSFEEFRNELYEDLYSYSEYYYCMEPMELSKNTREGCKNDKDHCGAYLYENGFVMDY